MTAHHNRLKYCVQSLTPLILLGKLYPLRGPKGCIFRLPLLQACCSYVDEVSTMRRIHIRDSDYSVERNGRT